MTFAIIPTIYAIVFGTSLFFGMKFAKYVIRRKHEIAFFYRIFEAHLLLCIDLNVISAQQKHKYSKNIKPFSHNWFKFWFKEPSGFFKDKALYEEANSHIHAMYAKSSDASKA